MADAGLPLLGNSLQNLPGGATVEQISVVLNDVITRLNAQLETQVFSDTTSKRFLSGYQPGGWPGGDFGVKVSPAGVDVTSCPFKKLLFAQDFATGIQYFNVNGKTLTEIGPSLVKIAQSGFDVDTATNAQLVLNSGQDNFRVVKTDTATVVVGAGDTAAEKVTTIPHGLGFVPTVEAYIQNPSGDIQSGLGEQLCPSQIFSEFSTGTTPSVRLDMIQYYSASADATNLYLKVLSADVTFFTQLQGTFHFRYYLKQQIASA